MNIKMLSITIGFVFTTLSVEASAPTGLDNQGGVACPAGTYYATPNVLLVGLNAYTGNATRVVNDISVASISEVGLNFVRYYNTRGNPGQFVAYGQVGSWQDSTQWTLTSTTINGIPTIQVIYPNGTTNSFTQTSTNIWTSSGPVTDIITPQTTGYILTTKSNIKYIFTHESIYSLVGYYLTSIVDSKNLTTTFSYTTTSNFPVIRTTKVTEPGGRYLTITYIQMNIVQAGGGAANLYYLHSVTTSDGRTATYAYTTISSSWGGTVYSAHLLSTVFYSGIASAAYSYKVLVAPNSTQTFGTYGLSQAIDSRAQGIPNIKYSYFSGSSGAVQTISEGSSNTLICTLSLAEDNTQTPEVTFPDGSFLKYNVNTGGLLASITNSLNNSQLFSYTSGTGTWTTTTTDSNGNVSSSTQTTAGKVVSVTLPPTGAETAGPIKYYYYNTAGYLTSFVDSLGHTITLTRDPTSNLITSVGYPDGTSEGYTYNSFNEILTHTQRNGGIEYFTYNSTGLLLTRRDATQSASQLTTMVYNSNYRIASVTDADGHTTSYQYNDEGLPTTITNPDGTTRTFAYNAKMVLSVTNELNHVTSYAYDGFNRLLTVTDPLSRVTTYTYDSNTPTNSHPTLVTLPSGKQSAAMYTAAWDYETTSVTTGYGTSDASTTSYAYDSVGNVIAVTDSRGNTTQVGYDARNRKVWAQDPASNTSYFYYDDNDNLTATITPDGTTTNVYDVMNRLAQSTDPQSQIVHMTYNAGGSLQSYEDPNGNTYAYAYDLDERQLSMQYPDTSTELYSYDPVGNMSTYTTRDGKVKSFSYDSRNRNTLYNWSDGMTPSVTTAYDNGGRIISLSNANSALTYTYDNDNELLTESQNVSGLGTKTVSYAYNSDGIVNTLTYPDNTVLTYGYDNRNQITSIQQGSTTVVNYTYDAAGNRTGKNLANGVNSTLTYDAVERLTSIVDLTPVPTSDTQLQSFNYGYDAMSRRKYVKRDGALGDVYAYGPSGQVTSVEYNAANPDTTPTSPQHTVNYSLDASGNRTQVADSIMGTTSYTSNADNQYSAVGGNSLTYDGKGNLSAYSGWTYTYDAQNRLTQATTTIYTVLMAYDPLGRCVKRTENGANTYLVYDNGWNLLADYNAAGSQVNRYVNGTGTDEILTKTDNSSNVIYYHVDGMGSITKLTSSTGTLLEQYSYDIFGQVTIENASGAVQTTTAYNNRFFFTGREYLSSLGLYDYRTRFYSPTLGRFLQPDSIGHLGDTYNLHRYCGNDPVNNTDSFGLDHGNSDSDPGITLYTYGGGYSGYNSSQGWIDTTPGDSSIVTAPYVEINLTPAGTDFTGNGSGGANGIGGASKGALPGIQAGLTIAGLIPGVGEFANAANAIISLTQGDYVGAGASAFAMIPVVGAIGDLARLGRTAEEATTVIGRVKDLQNLGKGEQSLLDRLPNLGNPKANWAQNSGVLRSEMNRGLPIRDASPGDNEGVFLNAERNLLQDRGWNFDENRNMWNPPKQ